MGFHNKPPLGSLPIFEQSQPVGLWLMNESSGNIVQDLSGNGNTGTFVNSPVWVAAKNGPGIEFVRSDSDYISFGDKDAFSFTTGSHDLPFSIVASLKSTDLTTANPILAKYLAVAPWNGEWFFAHNPDGTLYFQCLDGGAFIRIKSTSSIVTGIDTPFHAVVTYDGSGSETGIELYIDGKRDTGATQAEEGAYTKMDNTTSPLEIGGSLREYALPLYSDAVIDYVFLYNCALTASEITRLYTDPFYQSRQDPIELWTSADLDQPHWRILDDDAVGDPNGDPDDCTPLQNVDTAHTGVAIETPFHVRMQITNNTGGNSLGAWDIYYNDEDTSVGAVVVGAALDGTVQVDSVAGTVLDSADTDDSTLVFDNSGSFTWQDGEFDEVDARTDKLILADGFYADFQFCVQFTSLAQSDTSYFFFILLSAAALDTYTGGGAEVATAVFGGPRGPFGHPLHGPFRGPI